LLNSREPDEPEELNYDSTGSSLAEEIEDSIYSPWTASEPDPTEDDK